MFNSKTLNYQRVNLSGCWMLLVKNPLINHWVTWRCPSLAPLFTNGDFEASQPVRTSGEIPTSSDQTHRTSSKRPHLGTMKKSTPTRSIFNSTGEFTVPLCKNNNYTIVLQLLQLPRPTKQPQQHQPQQQQQPQPQAQPQAQAQPICSIWTPVSCR